MAGPIRISIIANARQALAAFRDVDTGVGRLARNLDRNTRNIQKSIDRVSTFGRVFAVTASRVGIFSGAVLLAIPPALKLAGALAPTVGIVAALPGIFLGGAAAVGVFKLATHGMKEAIETGLTGTMQEFQKSMKDFGPNMKRFATGIVGLKNPFLELRKAAGEDFFGAFADSISGAGKNLDLADAYLPMFRKQIPKMAKSLGGLVKGAIDGAMSKDSVSGVETSMKNMSKAIDNASVAVEPLVKAFFKLAGVGSSVLPRLGKSIGDIGTKFAKWIDAAVDSGRAMSWIENGITAFKQLGTILSNVGTIVKAFYSAANTGGNTLLATVADMTGKWAKFLSSAEGGERLKKLFDDLFKLVGAFSEGALAAAIPLIGMFAKTASEITQKLVPAIKEVTQYFEDNQDTLKNVVIGLLALKAALLLSSIALKLWAAGALVGKVAMFAWNAAQTASLALTNLTMGANLRLAASMAATRIAIIAGSVAAGIATAAQWAWNVAMSANPIGLIVLAIAALVAGIIYLATRTKFFQTIWGALTNAFNATWNWVKKNWPLLLAILTGPIGLAVRYISQHWNNITKFTSTAFNNIRKTIVNVFSGAVNWLRDIGRNIMSGLAAGIDAGMQWIRDRVSGLGNLIPDWLRDVLGISSPSKVMMKIGMQTMDGFAVGFKPETGKALVKDLAKSLTATKLPALSTSLSATPSYSGSAVSTMTGAAGMGNIIVNVNIPETADLSRLGDHIEDALRAVERRTGRQLLVTRGAA